MNQSEFEKMIKQIRDMIAQSTGEFKEKLEDTATKMTALQKQFDGMDLKLQEANRLTQAAVTTSAVRKTMEECDGLQRLVKDRRGTAVINFKGAAMQEFMQRKTTILETGLGFATTGVVAIDRVPGITPEARQQLSVRSLLSARPTTMAVVDFVRVLIPLSIASPVPEASLKPENQLSFNSLSEKIRTLATWIPASKQVLDDLPELMGFIQTSMPYYVNLEEELQILSGDGTGENLHGLIPQASVFVPGSLPAGSTRIDAIGAAIGQITAAKELPPTFVVLHPADWWGMRLLKNTFGQYILGDPQTVVSPTLFGLDVAYTTSIAQHTFLVGSGSPIASEIRDRMEMQVEVSTEHQDFFVKNLVAIRAEKRLALVVKRPGSYIAGSFTGLSLAGPTNGVGGSPYSYGGSASA